MPDMAPVTKAEWENLEKRARKLAGEKSYLQLLINMMQQFGAIAGLENVVDAMPRIMMENIGGTNLILYYFIDQDIYSVDLYGNKTQLDTIADPHVAQVVATREMAEYQLDAANSLMQVTALSHAWTWVFPLLVGSDLIGVFKIENLHISTQDWRKHLPTFFNYAALVLKNEILGHTRLQQAYHQLEHEVAARQTVEEELRTTNEELRLKLDTLLLPDEEIDEEELRNIINVPDLHSLMTAFHEISNVASAIIDLKGEVLVGIGWQNVCVKFHRVHPQTLENCRESDLVLTRGVPEGRCQAYRCKNKLWDVSTPLFIGGKHVANIFLGQFFYEDEPPDFDEFAAQAEQFGFDKAAYLAALRQVPLCSREKIDHLMAFYGKFSTLVSKLSFSNLKLAKSLLANKRIEDELRQAKDDLEQKVNDRTVELSLLNETLEQRVHQELARNREKDLILIQQSRLATMGEMMHNVAHQWRQPLSGMMLIMQNIQDEYQYGELTPESLKHQVERGVQLAQKMSDTIDDFRNFFRPDRLLACFNLKDSVHEALSLVEASFHNNQIEVVVESTGDVYVTGFANEFSQVLLNVLNNAKDAIKAAGAGNQVTIQVGHQPGFGVIKVRDNGGGIPAEVLPKVFDPYFTTRESGTGIGLYMSRMIMEHMHGRIEARNLEGGAEILIAVPEAAAPAEVQD